MSVLASPARATDGRWTGEKPLDARGGVEPCFTYDDFVGLFGDEIFLLPKDYLKYSKVISSPVDNQIQ